MQRGIYVIRCDADGDDRDRLYLGSSSQIERRWRLHRLRLRRGNHHSPELQRCWSLYGEQAFAFEVIETLSEDDDLFAREQHWMDELGAVAFGFNVCPFAGSARSVKRSAETRAKISMAHKGKTVGPETRALLSEIAKRGNADPERAARQLAASRASNSSPEGKARAAKARLAMAHTPESRAKIAEAMRLRRLTAVHRAKIGEANRRRVVTAETRAKMSAAKLSLSDDTRAKMGAAQRARRAREKGGADASA